MALQVFPNGKGFLLVPLPPLLSSLGASNTTMDAAGESHAIIGHLILSSGPGTSKTLDTSGKVHFKPGAVTFANASTTLKVGVQGVASGGLEDTSYSVYGEFVGGTDTITASVVNTIPMENGSLSMTHGTQYALVFEMTGRGGADSLAIPRYSVSGVSPHSSVDSGSGPAVQITVPQATIEFADGTVGWFGNDLFAATYEIPTTFSTSSNPDEHALVFQVPFECTATGLYCELSGLGAADDFELILYSDPLGTPVAERTIQADMSFYAAAGIRFDKQFTSAFTLQPNTSYAVALRPTTTNAISYQRLNFGSGNGELRRATMLGDNWSLYTRDGNSGAFGNQDVTVLPNFGIWVGSLSDNEEVGGGAGGCHVLGGTVIR